MRLIYGIMMGDKVILTDPDEGKPVVEASKPEEPEGYHADMSYVDAGTEISQTWTLVPDEGSVTEAIVALAKMQAAAIDDADAVKVPALYDEWSGKGVKYYGPDDPEGHPQTRLRFQGLLVKCLQTHTSQPDWAPNAAPSLWALVLPGQDGSGVVVGIWIQPGADNGYDEGDKELYNGHIWESTQNDNIWKPGDVGAPWTDLGEAGTAASMRIGAHFA